MRLNVIHCPNFDKPFKLYAILLFFKTDTKAFALLSCRKNSHGAKKPMPSKKSICIIFQLSERFQ